MSNRETTINKIRYNGIEILLPAPITVNLDEIKYIYLYKNNIYTLILNLYTESLLKMLNEESMVRESEENE